VPEGERQSSRGTLHGVPQVQTRSASSTTSTLGQLPNVLFAPDVQQEARTRFAGAQDPKQRLVAAVSQIAPVRNEIAHVREIDQDRLLRASVACADVLEMLKGRP
jgi:FlaA1/EpsC-like NDP-sugar epimerase